MHQAKLSSKNQIVIPRDVRKALRLKAGDRLLLVVRGDMVILLPKPKNHATAILGIGRGVYSKDHVETERGTWR